MNHKITIGLTWADRPTPDRAAWRSEYRPIGSRALLPRPLLRHLSMVLSICSSDVAAAAGRIRVDVLRLPILDWTANRGGIVLASSEAMDKRRPVPRRSERDWVVK